jgi:hypothetical protein
LRSCAPLPLEEKDSHLEKSLLIEITNQLRSVLGSEAKPEYRDRLAAVQFIVGNSVGLVNLDDANGSASWSSERIGAARDFLVQTHTMGKLSRQLLCQSQGKLTAKRHGIAAAATYVESLVHWALFEEDDNKRGLQIALSHTNISGNERWKIISALLLAGYWRLQSVLPGLLDNQDFSASKVEIWSLIVGCYPHFTQTFPHLADLEKRVDDSYNSTDFSTRYRPKEKDSVRVAVWSHKLGGFLSSITVVHPWLLKLAEPSLTVYVLSERRTNDDVQKQYRNVFGDHFIDCDGLSDAQFITMVQGLDLDVFMPLHPARPHLLEKHRFARCHFDVWGDLPIYGTPDVTLMSAGMLDSAFIKSTRRKFIVIPDPLHVYSALPPVALKPRLPGSVFCFGAFNRGNKANNQVFDVWARVLKECEKSVLLVAFLQADFFTECVLKLEFAKRGIDPARITVAPRVGHTEHLDRHNLIDLMLDTFPLGAGMTAVDTAFMGVPLLSLSADIRPAALHTNRAFFSHLGSEAGISASTTDDYVNYAIDRYKEGPRSVSQRQNLRARTLQSGLFDDKGYVEIMRRVLKIVSEGARSQVTVVDHDTRGAF